MRIIYLVILLFFVSSCERKPQQQVNESAEKKLNDIIKIDEYALFTKDSLLELCYFTIAVPKGWHRANDDTLIKVADHTCRVRLHNKNNKLVYFEQGLSVSDLSTDLYVERIAKREVYLQRGLDTTYVVFSNDPKLYISLKSKTHKIHAESISGYTAKAFEPVKSGRGYAGIYIDSIDQIAGNKALFCAYAENLNRAEYIELLEVLKTIEIKPFR